MTLKIPPPPQFTGPQWQLFNRWLLELTSILSNTGGINPASVVGLSGVIAQSAANNAAIAVLQPEVTANTAGIATLNAEVAGISGQITTINGQITTLGARAQVYNDVVDPAPGLGSVGDWAANTAGGVGHRIFVKTAVATWTAFPF